MSISFSHINFPKCLFHLTKKFIEKLHLCDINYSLFNWKRSNCYTNPEILKVWKIWKKSKNKKHCKFPYFPTVSSATKQNEKKGKTDQSYKKKLTFQFFNKKPTKSHIPFHTILARSNSLILQFNTLKNSTYPVCFSRKNNNKEIKVLGNYRNHLQQEN